MIERIDSWFDNGGVPTCYKVPDILGNVVKEKIPESFRENVFKLFVKLADYKIENKDICTIKTMQKSSEVFFGSNFH